MNTALSLLVAVMACTMGLLAIGIGILCMGFSGAPGAILFEIGKRRGVVGIRVLGVLAAGFAQAFVVGCYIVLVVSLLHVFVGMRPTLPAWPLWIAAAFHAIAIPGYAGKEKKAEATAQYLSLPLVSVAAVVVFVMTIVSPASLAPLFGWLPYFQAMVK